jgi:hypothetical protein
MSAIAPKLVVEVDVLIVEWETAAQSAILRARGVRGQRIAEELDREAQQEQIRLLREYLRG